MLRGVKNAALGELVRFGRDGLMDNVRFLAGLLSHMTLDVIHGVRQ